MPLFALFIAALPPVAFSHCDYVTSSEIRRELAIDAGRFADTALVSITCGHTTRITVLRSGKRVYRDLDSRDPRTIALATAELAVADLATLGPAPSSSFLVVDPWLLGEPAPLGTHLETRKKRGLLYSGLGALGGGWIANWVFTAAGCQGCGSAIVAASLLPIAGPFVQLTLFKGPGGFSGIADTVSGVLALVIDAACQITGAALLIAFAAIHRDVLLFDGPASVQAMIVPTALPRGGGLAAMGTF